MMAAADSDRARFDAKWTPEPTTGCWLWTAATNSDGYGLFRIGGRLRMAHRVSYEMHVGPVPDGLEIDHVRARGCSGLGCVNPEHLEPVTQRENWRRSGSRTVHQASQTHCNRGHELGGDNLLPSSTGRRRCRACRRAWDRRSRNYQRRKAQP